MKNVAHFPDKECVFIGRDTDDTGQEIHILEHFVNGKRTRIGEYPTILALVLAMDAITGIERPGGAA